MSQDIVSLAHEMSCSSQITHPLRQRSLSAMQEFKIYQEHLIHICTYKYVRVRHNPLVHIIIATKTKSSPQPKIYSSSSSWSDTFIVLSFRQVSSFRSDFGSPPPSHSCKCQVSGETSAAHRPEASQRGI